LFSRMKATSKFGKSGRINRRRVISHIISVL
jgi:hypothetical protein